MEGATALEQLSREGVEFPSLDSFQASLDKFLCKLLWVTLLQQEDWTAGSPEVISNPNYSVILW